MKADRGDSAHCTHLIPSVANPVGHHHRRDDLDNDTYMVMATGQGNAEIKSDGEPSLTCNHEAPIVIGFDSKQGGDTQLGNTPDGCPPLKGINRHAVAFQARIARNGHGVPSCADSALQASATGDSKPLIAFAQNTRDEVREMEVCGSLAAQPGMKQQTYLKGNFGVRRLTPTECERLMGLPDGWTSGFSDSVRYRMIGNSAAVPVIQWLAKAIKQALTQK